MAKVTNAYTTYSATSNREDLANTIANIDPFETPVITAIGSRNATNVTFEWQTENLPAVSTSSEIEGFEISRTASTATTRLNNVCQINSRNATVSGTQEESNAAGKRSEMAHQLALIGKAIKRDIESVLSGTVQVLNAGNDTTARATRPIENWLETNGTRAGDGSDPVVSSNTAVTDGTQRAFTEDLLLDELQQCYGNGAEPSLCVVGPFNKRQASTFTGRTNSRHMIQANKVVQSVTMYASDYTDLKIITSRFSRERSALLLDPRYAKMAWFRKYRTKDIAPIGDAETKLLIAEWGLEMTNEAAHGVVADLTTS